MSVNLNQKKVVVAMSGGVDSSVAAILLHRQGYEVVGISMQVWDYRQNGGCRSKATCCAPDDFTDARKVASKIGVPYYVFDFEKTFRREVIDQFISSYQKGLTPNPCVECNNKVKFRELRDRAYSFGCHYVSTGHYARLEKDESGLRLLRAVDREKDQTYFLYGLSAEELERTIFPVGHMLKSEVREAARAYGLVTADKPESQDICFVSGTVQDFLHQIGGLKTKGDIINSDGKKIGEHDGIHNFTVGQRRGMALGGLDRPIYVLNLDFEKNQVMVGDKDMLRRESFYVNEINLLKKKEEECFEAIAQVRSRHKGVKVKIKMTSHASAQVFFSEEWAVASPGQAAVFYDLNNEEVLGGGKIKENNYAC